MKKKIYLFAAALAIVWAGCTDDELVKKGIPVQTGDEILFGSSISKNNNQNAEGVETKTIYGERTETGIPVRWDPEGDHIAIFCPQASAPERKMVNYVVKPDTQDQTMDSWNTSATVQKEELEQAGLQWGPSEEHRFYALYPAKFLKNASSDEVANHGILTATISPLQNVSKWVEAPDPITRGTIYYGVPNMDYAYMWAHAHIKKSEIDQNTPIKLEFKNLVTVMDITIPGPADPNEEVTITNINMISDDPEDLMTGDFHFYIKDGEGADHTQGTCEPVPSEKGEVRNTISISCYNNEKKQFITLKGPNESLNVKAYIVPNNTKDHIQDKYRMLKFTVAMLNGAALTKTLTSEQLSKLQPQKVNRIVLPRVKNADPAYWMSNLDPNIYLSELSIPGSKMSYSVNNDGDIPAFQNKGISEQFDAGVRAFIIQVEANNRGNLTIPKASNKDLSETLKEISEKLNTAAAAKKTNEFAVVVLTAQTSDYKHWIQTVAECLNKYSTTAGISLYTDPITPNTTIKDVGNKIVVKVNYNEKEQENYISSGSNIPAMFAIWKNPNDWTNPDGVNDFCPVSDLYWGDMQGTAQMKWMAAEVTHVGTTEITDAEISQADKISSIKNMLNNSVTAYQNNQAHDTWFMTDAGGVYKTTTKTGTWIPREETTYSTTDLAKEMNQLVVEELQKRGQNASTGIVFINFADRDPESGAQYKSDYILASVIDNNFKFSLRKVGSSAQ